MRGRIGILGAVMAGSLVATPITPANAGAFPGPSGKIAFSKGVDDDGNGSVEKVNIFVMDPVAGARQDRLTTGARDMEPEFSPDGRRIAFTRWPVGGMPAVFVMNSNGTGQTQLAVGDQPTWSPDGSKIAFRRVDASGERIMIMAATPGAAATPLLSTSDIQSDPAWSPDGTKIAYTNSYNGRASDIWLAAANGSANVQQTSWAAADRRPVWSPDGSKIAFDTTARASTYSDVFVMTVDGSSGYWLSALSQERTGPTWSPDGKRIAFVAKPTHTYDEMQDRAADGSGSGDDLVVPNARDVHWGRATLAGPPAAPVATPYNAKATIAWKAPFDTGGGAFTRYDVVKSDGSAACTVTVSTGRSCTATGLKNGTAYRFKVRLVTTAGAGAWSALSNAVVPDGTAPTASLTAPSSAWVLGTSTTVKWTAADVGGSGLAKYQVRYLKAPYNGPSGAWIYPSAWQAVTTTSLVAPGLAAGYTYCFSVRALDRASNASAWSAMKCTRAPLDDRALTRSGGWWQSTSSTAYKGTLVRATAKGQVVSKSNTQVGRVAVVATKCSGCGTVAVKVGSVTVGTVSLAASSTLPKQVIALPPFAIQTGATVSVVVTSSGKPVIIDGLGISRL